MGIVEVEEEVIIEVTEEGLKVNDTVFGSDYSVHLVLHILPKPKNLVIYQIIKIHTSIKLFYGFLFCASLLI